MQAFSVLPAFNQQWARANGVSDAGGVFKASFGAGTVATLIGFQVNLGGANKTGRAQFYIGQNTTPLGPNQNPYTPPCADGNFTVAPVVSVGGQVFYIEVSGASPATTVEVFALYQFNGPPTN